MEVGLACADLERIGQNDMSTCCLGKHLRSNTALPHIVSESWLVIIVVGT